MTAIRQHLLGTNQLVGGVERFVKTTPPGPGSGVLTLEAAHPIIAGYSVPAGDAALMHVGTYESGGIGTSCYHSNLAILENMLSHAELGPTDWIVCDMVAGTDAFSNSLHAQFDAIAIVVEPTPESTSVARKYRELADAAGTADSLILIGNKTDDAVDRAYLERETGSAVLAALPSLPALRRARQRGERPVLASVGDTAPFQAAEQFTRTSPMTDERRFSLLCDLHQRYAQQDWVRSTYGDLTAQIPAVAVAQ